MSELEKRDGVDLSSWLESEDERKRLLAERKVLKDKIDTTLFERSDLDFVRKSYVQYFFFGYDSSFFNTKKGVFAVDDFLDDGEKNFGGYDQLIIWQPYPRMGIDERSQLEFWRDFPGGLSGLKDFISACHDRGVKCLLNHVRWDINRPHSWEEDMKGFGEIIKKSGADGLWGDTLNEIPLEVRKYLDSMREGMFSETEYNCSLSAFSRQNASWSQGYNATPLAPHIQRWIDSRFMLRMVNRGAKDKRPITSRALFWGLGICVWENIFGYWNPFTARDRAHLKKVVSLLREYHNEFLDQNWQPLTYLPAEGIYGNKFTSENRVIITLLNTTDEDKECFLKTSDMPSFVKAYDAWSANELAEKDGGFKISVEANSCSMAVFTLDNSKTFLARQIVAYDPKQDMLVMPSLSNPKENIIHGRIGEEVKEYVRSEEENSLFEYEDDFRTRVPLSAHTPKTYPKTEPPKDNEKMLYIEGGRMIMSVTHNSRMLEGGCYSDGESMAHPPQYFWLESFYIDETEVTNASYKKFLSESLYKPLDITNFLRHWEKPNEENILSWNFPKGKEEHPVVWVSLEDALAYATWKGARLPREEEWQRVAEGKSKNLWTWGNEFDISKCNHGSVDTTDVYAYKEGRTEEGVLDMIGNVWEWTASERNDGHTRYAILRGGSYHIMDGKAHPEGWGKMWYTAQGAQHNRAHQKMLLLNEGINRCSTVGFRCVKDA